MTSLKKGNNLTKSLARPKVSSLICRTSDGTCFRRRSFSHKVSWVLCWDAVCTTRCTSWLPCLLKLSLDHASVQDHALWDVRRPFQTQLTLIFPLLARRRGCGDITEAVLGGQGAWVLVWGRRNRGSPNKCVHIHGSQCFLEDSSGVCSVKEDFEGSVSSAKNSAHSMNLQCDVQKLQECLHGRFVVFLLIHLQRSHTNTWSACWEQGNKSRVLPPNRA